MDKQYPIRVLTYHQIESELDFEEQILFLKSRYNILSIENFKTGSESQVLKKNNLMITFDDASPSVYKMAFPILKKYNVPATIFVITSLIGTDEPFWWDELEYYLGKEKGKEKTWEIKSWKNKEREEYLKRLRTESDNSLMIYKQLTSDQLQEMQKSGITIANHSHSHPMFDRCTMEELENEMTQSTNILKTSGFSPEYFAYPNGNFSLQAEKILKDHGVKMAFLFDHKINTKEGNPLRVSRLVVNDTTPMWKFKLILSGWHTRILPLTRFAGKLTREFKR